MTTLYFPRCRETGASVYGAPRVPVDSRYVGAAALERAILDAAALAPEFAPRGVRAFPDGAYSLPPMQWSDGADGMPAGYRAAHGPVMPEPPEPERIRVEFHYLTGDGTRGYLTADNLAPGLVSLAAKVRRAAAAWDGKVRRAPRTKAAPASAPHVAARALWAEGSFADALALAANVGAVFFGAASPGHDPMAYMQARPADVADVGATIARSIVSGKFRVLHTASGLAIDDAKHGAPTGGFSSFSAALDWLEERAADADWMAKLQRAAAKAPTWDQAAGAAHYAPADSDPAGNMPGAAPESTHAAANDATSPDAPDPAPAAPAGSIAAESAPVADAVSRAARDIVAEFYDSQLRGAPGETVPADAIEARAQWLRGTAAGFADLPNPERGAPYAEAAQMLERDAAAKRDAQRAAIAQTPGHAFAGPPGADSGPAPAAIKPYPGFDETRAAVYRAHLVTARAARELEGLPPFDPTAAGGAWDSTIPINRLRARGADRPAGAQALRDRVAAEMRAKRSSASASAAPRADSGPARDDSEPERIAGIVRARTAPAAFALREAAAELERRAGRVPADRAEDYRAAAAILRRDAETAPESVPGFRSRGARMLQSAMARSAARNLEDANFAPIAAIEAAAAPDPEPPAGGTPPDAESGPVPPGADSETIAAHAAFDNARAAGEARRFRARVLADTPEVPECGGSVRFHRPGGGYPCGIAGPDMSAPGGWRFSTFDGAGPISHSEHASLASACEDALSRGFEPVPAGAPDPAGLACEPSPPGAESGAMPPGAELAPAVAAMVDECRAAVASDPRPKLGLMLRAAKRRRRADGMRQGIGKREAPADILQAWAVNGPNNAAAADALEAIAARMPDPPAPTREHAPMTWDDWRRIRPGDDIHPDAYAAHVIACYGEARERIEAAGAFPYNADAYPLAAALMAERYGYPDARQLTDDGGDGVARAFGTACYQASCILTARRSAAAEKAAADRLHAGAKYPRLIFHGKQYTGATLQRFTHTGAECELTAKCAGRQVTITCSATALERAAERAAERAERLKEKRKRARPDPVPSVESYAAHKFAGGRLSAAELGGRMRPIAGAGDAPAEPPPVESAPPAAESEPPAADPGRVSLILHNVLAPLQNAAPDGVPSIAGLESEAARIDASAQTMAGHDYADDGKRRCGLQIAANYRAVARSLRELADAERARLAPAAESRAEYRRAFDAEAAAMPAQEFARWNPNLSAEDAAAVQSAAIARHARRSARTVDPERYATDTHERPCAAPGLTSYRARGAWGWIMIGARDDADAMREARRSSDNPRDLQRWNGREYVPCTPAPLEEPGAPCKHPPARLFAGNARNADGIARPWVACCDCGAVLAGGAQREPDPPSGGAPWPASFARAYSTARAAGSRGIAPPVRIPGDDPRARIPGRFAPVYCLRGVHL